MSGYKRKRKNRSFRYGILIFILLFMSVMTIKSERNRPDEEAMKKVTESELSGLIKKEDQLEEEKEANIRVLILGNKYKGETHSIVKLKSESDISLLAGEKQETIKAGETLILEPDDKRFASGVIRVSSNKKIRLEHLERNSGIPSYEGEMELRNTAEGIVIINEIPVEKYLKAVVPSEMPASYELEALKAQAVCARSYAYRQMEKYAYPEYEAHVNDSTDYQVYGNSKTHKRTNQAIRETKGEIVYYKDKIATTYYYSTSCGKTTDVRAWGTKESEKNAYLKSVNVKGEQGDYEKNLPWYRWSANIPVEKMSDRIGLYAGKDIGRIKSIEVTKRGGGDIAVELKVVGEKDSLLIETENKIRRALGGNDYQIILNDGSVTNGTELLPSAFFTIKKEDEIFIVEGGGLGHGIGMSQNGANQMAKHGKSYREILELFYQNIEIR